MHCYRQLPIAFKASTSCTYHHVQLAEHVIRVLPPIVQAWSRGSVHSYYPNRPWFDSHPRHLSAHRARRMLHMRLDFFSNNHMLDTACPTHGNNMSSERSAAHDCIDEKGRRLDMVVAKRYPRQSTCV